MDHFRVWDVRGVQKIYQDIKNVQAKIAKVTEKEDCSHLSSSSSV